MTSLLISADDLPLKTAAAERDDCSTGNASTYDPLSPAGTLRWPEMDSPRHSSDRTSRLTFTQVMNEVLFHSHHEQELELVALPPQAPLVLQPQPRDELDEQQSLKVPFKQKCCAARVGDEELLAPLEKRNAQLPSFPQEQLASEVINAMHVPFAQKLEAVRFAAAEDEMGLGGSTWQCEVPTLTAASSGLAGGNGTSRIYPARVEAPSDAHEGHQVMKAPFAQKLCMARFGDVDLPMLESRCSAKPQSADKPDADVEVETRVPFTQKLHAAGFPGEAEEPAREQAAKRVEPSESSGSWNSCRAASGSKLVSTKAASRGFSDFGVQGLGGLDCLVSF